MKVVREHINEKFVEDSDPIRDMGIGLYMKRDFNNYLDLHKWLYKNAAILLHLEKIEDILKDPGECVINHDYYVQIMAFIRKYVTIRGMRVDTLWVDEFKQLVKDKLYKKVNEKFEEEFDPVSSMGIGVDVVNFYELSENTIRSIINADDGYEEWLYFIKGLPGKTITGVFEGSKKSLTFKIADSASYGMGTEVILIDTIGIKHTIKKYEKYYITK